MLRLIVRYRGYLILAGLAFALCGGLWMTHSAGAVVRVGPPSGQDQQNNQAYHGASFFGNSATTIGHGQGNTGNVGTNRGYNQDASANAGNQVSSQRKQIRTQVNNQQFRQSSGGLSGSGNSSTLIGAFQGNSGNSGLNFGNNQDNAGNSGNQVNNQGNIIGTQINKQGSSVTNDGNIILHQINYIQLFPGLRIYFSLRPKLTFAVSVGH
ncbi:MAG TPA: hypothetical protein VGD98_10750 [Ktedonobacteraceae bacterium]